MSTSKLLIVGVGILVRETQLLVCETTHGHIELPGFAVGKAEDILSPFNEFLLEQGISELPQQTLYLSSVNVNPKSKKKATGLVRIVRYSKIPSLNIPNSRYEAINELVQNTQASALVQAVAQWLLQAT